MLQPICGNEETDVRALSMIATLVLLTTTGCIRKSCEGVTDRVCELGSEHPDREVIDPDDPDYEDSNWTADQVQDAFAEARAEDDDAYRAYAAARDHADLLECPFCDCGCGPGNGHLSAVDCFKGMHGFT